MFGLRFCKIKQNIRKENSKLHRTEVSRNRVEVSRVQRWKFQEFAFKETFHRLLDLFFGFEALAADGAFGVKGYVGKMVGSWRSNGN